MALPKIDLPIYEASLISLNKKVRFRPFLVKEQKLFLMAAQSEDLQDTVKSIKQVLKNCVLDEVDIDSLPLFDLEYLFLQLRARSVGEVSSLRYTCNNIVKGEENEENEEEMEDDEDEMGNNEKYRKRDSDAGDTSEY